MSDVNNSTDKLTRFEQSLADLRPRSSLDRERLMFAAGQASVKGESATRLWQACALCATVAAAVMGVALLVSASTVETMRGREMALLERLNATDNTEVPNQGQEQENGSDTESGVNFALVSTTEHSQYNMRRLALESGVSSIPMRSISRGQSGPVTLGDARRMFAMVDLDDGLRHLKSLQPTGGNR